MVFKAARQGYADAEHSVGLMYEGGQGVSQDYNEGKKWHIKAANQGHADAQYSMELSHHNGHGGYQDIHEATYWYELASEQGHVLATKRYESLMRWRYVS